MANRPYASILAAPGGVLLLTFSLRVLTLDNQSLWYDEAFSLLLAHNDLPGIVERTARDTMPPLYYWLLHLWGTGAPVDFSPRLLSAAASTIAVALVFVIGRRLWDASAALWAALFTAVSPFQVFYGQEVRMYALLGLWNLLAAYGFLRGWQEGRWLGWALYGMGTALALYTHAIGGLPSLALLGWGVVTALQGRQRSRLRAPCVAVGIALLGYLPWLTVLLGQAREVLSSFWAGPPSVLSPLASLYFFYQGPFAPAGLVPLALAAVLLPLGCTLLPFGRSEHPDRSALGFLWAWLALPLLLLLVLSLVRSLYLERVVMGASFPLYLLLGWVAARTQPRWVGVALGMAALATAAMGLSAWLTDPAYGKPPQREAAAAVTAVWQPGTPVLHTSDGSYLPFLLYTPELPNWLLEGDPEQAARTARARSTYEALTIESVSVQRAVGTAQEFFLVIALDHSVEYQRDLAARIDQGYRRLDEQSIGGILLRRYQARGSGP